MNYESDSEILQINYPQNKLADMDDNIQIYHHNTRVFTMQPGCYRVKTKTRSAHRFHIFCMHLNTARHRSIV